MRGTRKHGILRNFLTRLKRMFRPEPDASDEPYAMVGAPKKPPLRGRSASAAEPLP
jgi:hypothetical protein